MTRERVQTIERLLLEKALLYAELVECFRKERAYLTTLELEGLWVVSEEKNRLCSEIRTLRSRIALEAFPDEEDRAYEAHRILNAIPAEERGSVRKAFLRILKLKKEVEMLRKENRTFIDDSLDFLDEMITILSGERGTPVLYNDRSRLRRPDGLVTLSREV